jgi:hypothetical protein
MTTVTKYVPREDESKHLHEKKDWGVGVEFEKGDKCYNKGATFDVKYAFVVAPGEDEPIIEPLQGQPGEDGTNGKTILNGIVPPTTQGTTDDFYLQTDIYDMYGPRGAGWGTPTSLIGPKGFHQGVGVPSSSLGINGDYYLESVTKTLYGPKTVGAWGDGISIMGADGANGLPLGEIVWVGIWSSGTTYDPGDGITNDGVPYVCIAESLNHAPPNASYWLDMSAVVFRQYNEVPAETPNGIITEFTLVGTFAPGSELVWLNGLLQRPGASHDYTTAPSLKKIYFISAPPTGSSILVSYDYGAVQRTANGTLSGSGAPSNSLGIDGDFYVATDLLKFYGPKADSTWPAGVSISALDDIYYVLRAGRSGGQTIEGDTASGGNLTLSSTHHATKGKIVLGSLSAYDQANGRLGIGTLSPSYPLHVVKSDANAATAFAIDNLNVGNAASTGAYVSSDIASITIRAHSAAYTTFDMYEPGGCCIRTSVATTGGLIIGVAAAAPMSFWTNNTKKMTLTSAGRLGINTDVPQSLLDVQGPAGTGAACAGILTLATKETSIVAADVLGQINFNAPLESDGTDAILVGASIKAIAEATFSTTVNATSLAFFTGASEAATQKVVITSAGKVGINEVAPASHLTVGGSIAITDGMTAPTATSGYAKIYVDSGTGDLCVIFGDGTTKTIVSDT